MIFLVTGALGAGKTSNTIWYLINDPRFKDRPKFATFIRGFKYEELNFEQIDKKDLENWVYWTDENDDFSAVSNFEKGSIILIDEADLFFPASLTDKNPPRWLREMARSRHHGLDFYIITQKASMISPFLLGLLQTHIYYHRPNGADYVNRYSWEHFQPNVNSRSNRLSGLCEKVVVPDEVFDLYESTVENTRIKTPPIHMYKKLAFVLLPMLLAPFIVYYVMYGHHVKEQPKPVTSMAVPKVSTPPVSNSPQTTTTSTGQHVYTTQDFISLDPTMPWKASAYADLVRPTDFPRIAACIVAEKSPINPDLQGCHCYTQQATPIDIPQSACLVMVKKGWFDNWATARAQQELVLSGRPDEASTRARLASLQKEKEEETTTTTQ